METLYNDKADSLSQNIINSTSAIKTSIQGSQVFQTLSKGALELRNIILKMLLAWIIGLIITYFFQTPIYNIYVNPLKENNLTLNFLSPMDSVMFYIKIYSISGLLISLPFQVLLLWQYMKDALLEKERKLIQGYFWVGATLSVAATTYGWLFMIPSIFKYLIGITPPQTQLLLTANAYSSFLFGIILMLIITFQIPLVVFILIRSGLVTKKQMTDKRKQIYVAILVFTGLFGSPDVFSWLMSTIPVIILFELSVFFSTLNRPNKQATEQISE
jgi:sec-independent protein translocase protein TatC